MEGLVVLLIRITLAIQTMVMEEAAARLITTSFRGKLAVPRRMGEMEVQIIPSIPVFQVMVMAAPEASRPESLEDFPYLDSECLVKLLQQMEGMVAIIILIIL
jgi:hypothetical protein